MRFKITICQGVSLKKQNNQSGYEILSSSGHTLEDKGCRCKRLLIKINFKCHGSRTRADRIDDRVNKVGKKYANMAVIMGLDQDTCVRRKVLFRRRSSELASRLQLYLEQNQNEDDSRFLSEYEPPKDCDPPEKEVPSRTISIIKRELPGASLGWPLLRRQFEDEQRCVLERGSSSTSAISWEESGTDEEETSSDSVAMVRPVESRIRCKLFSHQQLKKATRDFSSESLVGEGGCSSVYKGCLPDGNSVAVKVLKQYKEAWNDFSLEVEIMSSVKHQHITPLIGVCIEEDSLVLVYDFLSNGSLEESLQDDSKKLKLSWDVRFKVAVKVAEALNYLHRECQRPVIHRDVKSSNILLSSDLQPQLSDFGLAIWGPADSTHMINVDLVGTFGYMAPEYFMHGRMSEKVDIYSFGIVLLELISGRKPIITNGSKAQESIVKWAIPLIESGNHKALLDPKLATDQVDISQMGRMILAASLCIKPSARLRPRAHQIVELLKGEKGEREWISSYINYLTETSNDDEGDEPLTGNDYKPSFSPSKLELVLNDTAKLESSAKANNKKPRKKLKDYLKEDEF
ncbi:Protein kinase STUNTED [Linum perenne]